MAQTAPDNQNLGLVRINRCGVVPPSLHVQRSCRHSYGTVVLLGSKHQTESILQLGHCEAATSLGMTARLPFLIATLMTPTRHRICDRSEERRVGKEGRSW